MATCPICTRAFPERTTPGRRKRYCSKACQYAAAKEIAFQRKLAALQSAPPSRPPPAPVDRPTHCLVCGTPIVQRRQRGHPRWYCSPKCRLTAWIARDHTTRATRPRKKNLGDLPPVTCPICTTSFVPNVTNRIYCSKACTRRAVNEKRRDEYKRGFDKAVLEPPKANKRIMLTAIQPGSKNSESRYGVPIGGRTFWSDRGFSKRPEIPTPPQNRWKLDTETVDDLFEGVHESEFIRDYRRRSDQIAAHPTRYTLEFSGGVP